MARVLDTRVMPASERIEQVDAAVRHARLPATLRPDGEADRFHAEVDVWDAGGGREFLHWSGSPYRIWRGSRDVRNAGEHRVAVTVVGPGRWSHQHAGDDRVVDSRDWDLLLIDHTGEYRFHQARPGTTYAFNLDLDDLGLSADDVRRAIPRIPVSPVRHLVVQHVVAVARALDSKLPEPTTAHLGAATADLMRALIAGALDPGVRPHQDADALLIRTRMYVDRNFADPRLSATRIARVHRVSVRRLYQVWEGSEVSLAEYTMRLRVEAAAALLRADAAGSISAAARRCGFVDMSHFARRFRQAYGMSPGQWRTLNAAARHSLGDIP
jgi:AraC-like DNA-binding protein